MSATVVEGVAATALRSVLHRVRQAAEQSGRHAEDVRVVAVGKTKPVSLIQEIYDAGHRCFGENYVQEIIDKAPQLPDDIRWHFIGHLQSNKVKSLLAKSGVEPSDSIELAKHVRLGCPNLEFSGLMTIGMPDYSSTPENFKTLFKCRTEVCKVLGMAEFQCELSMGMSNDFEQAIKMGSTNVRIGSTIFGPREYPKGQ
ncbi:pyridoxal phosphate homeostasis protein isoform X2 [Coffea eugenioides]|uniref:Uncharacterized protein isoform X2 n=1 Tax=Coffea arabica TaxID=13443 RepID=A0A6P6S7L3_COFAR|nr:pyridoxal phosphate homeostasis protein-like isoform X2 [Coffea arabica]XP_027062140.1 pyridoxal phosphate homeostasis protein-like isoform X2 [Coffea arabica]XP_027064276.1 pyridoxal phosphate homeostasis protein-like isoform X2 [Coffea arabica]XP_027171234.1 pyridoxal phosphate homeostasis protein isoform X2 [Coffea eugenioides]